MKNFLTKIKLYAFMHKVISAIIIIVIIGGGYLVYTKINSTAGVTRYVLSSVTKRTIVSSVDGSGQVSALNQITINPTVSGVLTSVYANPGDKVTQGKTLFIIDDTTAQKTVRDAQIGLQNANLALQKLQIQNSSTNLNTALSKAYDDGFNTVVTSIYDLNATILGLNNNILSKSNLSDNSVRANGNTALDYMHNATAAYDIAQKAFQKNNSDYVLLNNNSQKSDIENIIQETYDATKLLSNAIKSAQNFVDYMAQASTNPSNFSSYQTTLATYTNTINTDGTNLLGDQTTISTNKDSFSSSDLNTQSAEISIKQAQNTLLDAQQNLSYYHITAPFSGVIASVPVIKGTNVSSGTTLATIITTQELATVTLNEVDVAKIALGEKVTLTFSAIPDLTITGQVVQIDSLGTVSQGVVNYNVKISFDTSDTRVKPGMSVDAKIITKVEQNVLTVPNSAVKTQGGVSYVQMFDTALPEPPTGTQGSVSATPPINQTVEVGISDATSTEITSGLKEGDKVVTRTINSTTKTTTATTAPSILGNTGGGNRGTGAVRIGG